MFFKMYLSISKQSVCVGPEVCGTCGILYDSVVPQFEDRVQFWGITSIG